MDATTTDINDLEKWVIGGDKIAFFAFEDDPTDEPLPLDYLSGYGVVLFSPDNREVGRFGIGLTGYSSGNVTAETATSFSVALDFSLNTMPGIYEYRLCAKWVNSTFDDSDYMDFTSDRLPIYLSVPI